jgi:hypothetical protein
MMTRKRSAQTKTDVVTAIAVELAGAGEKAHKERAMVPTIVIMIWKQAELIEDRRKRDVSMSMGRECYEHMRHDLCSRTDVKTIILIPIPAKKEIEMAAISQREKKREDEEKDGDSDRESDAEDTADKATSNTALLNLSALSLLPTDINFTYFLLS